MRNIKLMADYECFATWDEDNIINLNPDLLPISTALKERIHRWEEVYDLTLDRNDPGNSGFASKGEEEEFEAEGLELWRCLRQELGASFVVCYFSELRRALLDPSLDT
jgi:hypothetical protein